MTASLGSVVGITHLNLDAEQNERIRKLTQENRSKLKSSSSKKHEVNSSQKFVDAIVSEALPSNFNFDKSKPEDREHVKVCEKLFRLFSACGKLIGIQMAYDYSPFNTINFWIFTVLLIFTWTCVFYSQFIHIRNGDILRVLEPMVLYGVTSSCTQKIIGYLKKRHQLVSLFFCIRKICRQTLCGRQGDILKYELQKTFTFLKIFVVGVVSCLGMAVACPFKVYFVDNELLALLPIEIIFVDQSTNIGFATANFVMSILGIVATLGTMLYGSVFIYSIRMYSLQVNLIGQDFKDLDDMWAERRTVRLWQKQSFLRNICKKRQDIKNFMSIVADVYERKLFFYFCFNYFSQIICLFEITKNQWISGYGLALGLFVEMMFYCLMGTQIIIADDKLCDIIYASDWYRYDLSSQKLIMLLLHRSQQSSALELGPIGPLTMVTGIEIVKSIYSYYTVLTELF